MLRVAERRATYETMAVAAATCAVGLLYLWFGSARRVPLDNQPAGTTAWLGVDRWAALGLPWPGVFVMLATLVGLSVWLRPDTWRRAYAGFGRAIERRPVRLALAAASLAVFWVASTNRFNADGIVLEDKIRADVPLIGAHVTHDEMLELYVHSRLWVLANSAWGWSVPETYRVLSCLAGAVVVYLALGAALRFSPARRILLVAGLFAGGWVLVFFGDVENYTLTSALVFGFFLAAWRCTDGTGPLWPAAALLAVAAAFHLEALVFAPALVVLGVVAVRRGRTWDALLGAGVFVAILAATLWWFDSHGLPIERLFTRSHITAAGSARWARYLLPADGLEAWLQVQLLLLLAPAVVLLPALLVSGRLRREPWTVFLLVATGAALLMHFVWRAQLGAYDDWNLYAIVAQPVALLVFGTLAAQPGSRGRDGWLAALVVLFATHTIAWIAENHAVLS